MRSVDTPEMYEFRRGELERELERIVPRLVAEGALRIILFGSLVSGEVDTYSDIDLLIVMETEERLLDRMSRLYLATQPRMGLDMVVYTPRELEELAPRTAWLQRAIENGRVLYKAEPPSV